MRIADCVPSMSKIYLSRIVDSFQKEDVPKGDEDRLREQILQNIDEIADEARLGDALNLTGVARSRRILAEGILLALLEGPDECSEETALFERVREYEEKLVEESQNKEAFLLTDDRALDIFQAIVEVALEDDEVTADEFRLLDRLRRKLGISRHDHKLIEARLGKFPKPGSEFHTLDEFRDALKWLQTVGVLFYCNRAECGAQIVLPDEVEPTVKRLLGFEMNATAFEALLGTLSNDHLRLALKSNGLPLSGSKGERTERILRSGLKPSEVLEPLSNEELKQYCQRLPGVRVSGSKGERADRLIDYFASLKTKAPADSEDPRAVFYTYFEEFAARENQTLYSMNLIKHDRDMERAFEEGTRYLFEQKLGLPLVEMNGTEHADGGVEFSDGEVLLWDNKGKESTYTFPKAHADQFARYIRESVKRVKVFLVVVPKVDSEARLQALKLKHKTATDTDVAVVAADDLKWLAENWRKVSGKDTFNPLVFNHTGILTRADLEQFVAVFG